MDSNLTCLFEIQHTGGRFYVAAENIVLAVNLAKDQMDRINREGRADDDDWMEEVIDQIDQIGDMVTVGVWKSH